MALGDPYITLNELKEWSTIPDTVDDAALEQVTRSVSRQVNRFCHRQFNDAGTTSARTFDVRDPWYLAVDDFSTTAGLVVKTDTGNNGTYATTVTSTSVTAYPLGGIRDGEPGWPYNELVMSQTATSWPVWIPNPVGPLVQVTARWGWATVPPDVKQACLIQCAKVFSRKFSVNGLVGSSDFVFRVSTLPLDPDAAAMLEPLRPHRNVIA